MTFCIITKNERENLKNCLAAIRHFAPKADIVVVDTGSVDDSKEVAAGYAKKDVIRWAIGPLLQQSLDDIEIIVVDDASRDGTPQILVELDQQYPDRMKVVLKEQNSGPGDSRNIGLSYTEGEYKGELNIWVLPEENFL